MFTTILASSREADSHEAAKFQTLKITPASEDINGAAMFQFFDKDLNLIRVVSIEEKQLKHAFAYLFV